VIPSRSNFASLRQRRVHWRAWGNDDAPVVVMVHGWMDTSYTFQYVANVLADSFRILAPDLRGFGNTEWSRENASGYWFHDYIADLDAFIEHVSPEKPVHLVGHSLGGNIACIYAGVRATRVKTLVSLDGFGVPKGSAAQAADKLNKWLDAIISGESIRAYDSLAAVATRLQKNDPYLSEAMALDLATQWTEPRDGAFHVRADPAHKYPFSSVYRLDESIVIWKNIAAPTLWLGASHSHIAQWLGYGRDDPQEMGANTRHSEEFEQRLAAFSDIRFELIQDASHNLHHERAAEVAARLQSFFSLLP
jgi:pimeloyl-ACP methyl ester carboxylesterase